MTCCGPGDVVKTKFRVELATSAYPRDVWYALLDDVWVRIPEDRIVPDHAPDGQAHLFVIMSPPSMIGVRQTITRLSASCGREAAYEASAVDPDESAAVR